MTEQSGSVFTGLELDRAFLLAHQSRTDVVLRECAMVDEDLSDLDFSGWSFERCDVRRTRFCGAKLIQTVFRSCRGALANFTGAIFSEGAIEGGDFNNVVMRGAHMDSVRMHGCKLSGADLSGARAMGITFEEVLLVSARLPGFSFRKETLVHVDFSGADLRNCDFRGARFERSSLREASLEGSRFEGSDLRGADLGGIQLVNAALFAGAIISRDQATQLLSKLGLKVL